MKADPADQVRLLDVQASDSAAARLTHQRKSLPAIAQLAELDARRVELDRQRVTLATLVSDLEREQRKADAEVELVRTRKTRDEERLNSGVITNPKDLSSIQHELVAIERRITVLEDAELEVMESLETAQNDLSEVEAALAELDTERSDVTAERDAEFARIDAELESHAADRADVAQRVPDELLALYDKLRSQYAGLGAAALRARKCEACRLELNSADLRDIAEQAADDVVRCPECSRILVRTAESGLQA